MQDMSPAATERAVRRRSGRQRRTQAQRVAETRARLLDATVECLAEIGYARMTTGDVAERAGMSRGAQLYHFQNKAELVATAVEHLLDRLHRQFLDAVAANGKGGVPVTMTMTRSTYEETVRRLSRQSVTKHFDAYADVDWDAPDMAVDPDDARFELPAVDPLGATNWYRSLPAETRTRI